MDKVNFNDYDVTVEIYDSVIAKWVITDFDETDPTSTAYLRNRDKIQEKLSAGKNITIDETTNTISAELSIGQASDWVSKSTGNKIQVLADGFYVGFSGLLSNKGSVTSRSWLPNVANEFDAYYVNDEKLYVFAHMDKDLGLVWLPLSFYVDMSLYVSKDEIGGYSTNMDVTNAVELHNSSEGSHPYILSAISSLHQYLAEKGHFRGYFSTTVEIEELPNSENGDYAFNAETGTQWSFDGEWKDTGISIPDQTVPASDALPLMNGVASAGVLNEYSRGDHSHASDGTKLDKVSTSSTTTRAYCVGTNGSQIMEDVSSLNDANSIAMRDSSGELQVSEPTVDASAATKKYVDTSISGKVDKIVENSNGIVVYSVSNGNQSSVMVDSNNATPETLAMRTSVGTVVTATPLADSDAATKKYVDDGIDGVSVAQDLGSNFATYDKTLLTNVVARAIGRTQLLIQFTMIKSVDKGGAVSVLFSNVFSSILPALGYRFGFIWDTNKIEQVGFCSFDSNGNIVINIFSELMEETRYTLMV